MIRCSGIQVHALASIRSDDVTHIAAVWDLYFTDGSERQGCGALCLRAKVDTSMLAPWNGDLRLIACERCVQLVSEMVGKVMERRAEAEKGVN